MDEPLVKVRTPFQQENEKVMRILQDLKENNDKLNSLGDQKLTPNEIQTNRQQFQRQAQMLKDKLNSMEGSAKGVEQRRTVKDLKAKYAKEVERQKRLLKSFVNQSFEQRLTRISVLKASRGIRDTNDQNRYFMEPNNVVVAADTSAMSHQSKTFSINDQYQELMTEQDIIEYERSLIQERQDELDDIEKEAIMLNKLVGEVSQIANDQVLEITQLSKDKQFEQIQDNQVQVKGLLAETNEELQESTKTQQKKKKWLLIFVMVVLLIAAILLIVLIAKTI